MRLRIKSPAGRLERLELPGEGPTLAGAQAAVAQAFGLPSADDIVLSFNNKVHRGVGGAGSDGGGGSGGGGTALSTCCSAT